MGRGVYHGSLKDPGDVLNLPADRGGCMLTPGAGWIGVGGQAWLYQNPGGGGGGGHPSDVLYTCQDRGCC